MKKVVCFLMSLIFVLAVGFSLPTQFVRATEKVNIDYEKESLDNLFSFERVGDGYYVTEYKGNQKDITIPDYYNGRKVTGIKGEENLGSEFAGVGVFNGLDVYSVTMGDNLLDIGDFAFNNCTKLTIVNFGKNTKRIGKKAFRECTSLFDINIPDTIEVCGHDAFRNTGYYLESYDTFNHDHTQKYKAVYLDYILLWFVEGFGGEFEIRQGTRVLADKSIYRDSINPTLTKIIIPSSVEFIGEFAIGPREFNTLDGSVPRTEELVEFEDLSNVKFGESAFSKVSQYGYKDNGLSETSYGLKDGVYYFGTRATLYNDAIPTNLVIENGVTAIEDGAFRDCKKLESVKLPSSVTKIEKNAFKNCKNLTTIEFTGNVVIEEGAFSGCENLTQITGSSFISSVGDNAFLGCKKLNNLEFSNNVKIGIESFKDCENLLDVTFGNGISIGENAFVGTKLFKVENTIIEKDGYVLGYVGDIDTSINLTDKTVADGALKNSKITSLTLNNCNIGQFSFENSALQSVTITGGISLKQGVFYGCKDLETFTADSILSVEEFALFNTKIKSLSNVHNLAKNSLFGSSVESVSLTSNAQVEDLAFFNCPLLTEISISDSSNYLTENGVLYSKDKTKLICYPAGKVTQELVLPQEVNSFAEGAFSFAKIESISLSKNIEIPKYAFYKSEIKNFVMTASGQVKVLDYAFYGSLLENIKIDADKVSLGNNSLAYSENLVSLDVENSQISYACLRGCKSLKTLKITLEQTPILDIKLNGIDYLEYEYRQIHLQSGNLGFYFGKNYYEGGEKVSQNSGTESYLHYIPKIEEIVIYSGVVSQGAFMNMNYLTTFECGDSITSLGMNSFSSCDKLEQINIGSGILQIGSRAFEDCKALTTFKTNAELMRIGDFAFYNCINLESVEITQDLTIGSGAFANCHNLKTIKLYDREFLNNVKNYGSLFENAEVVTVGQDTLSKSEIEKLKVKYEVEKTKNLNNKQILCILIIIISVALVIIVPTVSKMRLKEKHRHHKKGERRRRHHHR